MSSSTPATSTAGAGSCLAQLAEGEAVVSLTRALEEMDASFTRARGGLLCDLSTALLRKGQREQALAHAREAAALAAQTGSVRQRKRVDRVLRQMPTRRQRVA